MPRAAANVVSMEPTNRAKMMNWSMPVISADRRTPSRFTLFQPRCLSGHMLEVGRVLLDPA